MTEQEWLTCDDPQPMLAHFDENMSRRKARLLACACCRKMWTSLNDSNRELILTAERYVDGQAKKGELPAGFKQFRRLGAAEQAVALTAYRHASLNTLMSAIHEAVREIARHGRGAHFGEALVAERAALAVLIRDIFGPLPFRPVAIDPAWLRWNHGTVPAIARRIYDERAFHDLPILADALEDAGCTDADLLAHCRCGGGHVRGCWALDLLLSRA
jgi:hypothetical protein